MAGVWIRYGHRYLVSGMGWDGIVTAYIGDGDGVRFGKGGLRQVRGVKLAGLGSKSGTEY